MFKKHIILYFLCFSSFCFSQEKKYFRLTDSVFSEGNVYTTWNIIWDFNGGNILPPDCYSETHAGCKQSLSDHSKTIDSLLLFFITHPQLTVEVKCHVDSRGNPEYNQKLTMHRSKNLCCYLTNGAITSDKIIPWGAGESEPLISEKEILKMKTREEQEKAHQFNRRTEFIIKKIDSDVKSVYVFPSLLSSREAKIRFSEMDSLVDMTQTGHYFFERRLNQFIETHRDSLAKGLVGMQQQKRVYAAGWKNGELWLFTETYPEGKDPCAIKINLSHFPYKKSKPVNTNDKPGIIYDFD